LTLAPERFVEEYLQFLGSLVPIILAFALGQLLWARMKDTRVAARVRPLFIRELRLAIRILETSLQELSVAAGSIAASAERDWRVGNRLKRLKELRVRVADCVDRNESGLAVDLDLQGELDHFTVELWNQLEDVSEMELRPFDDAKRMRMRELIRELNDSMARLRR
jgi:hypothetical protein